MKTLLVTRKITSYVRYLCNWVTVTLSTTGYTIATVEMLADIHYGIILNWLPLVQYPDMLIKGSVWYWTAFYVYDVQYRIVKNFGGVKLSQNLSSSLEWVEMSQKIVRPSFLIERTGFGVQKQFSPLVWGIRYRTSKGFNGWVSRCY
jgi:hypothetical protein